MKVDNHLFVKAIVCAVCSKAYREKQICGIISIYTWKYRI